MPRKISISKRLSLHYLQCLLMFFSFQKWQNGYQQFEVLSVLSAKDASPEFSSVAMSFTLGNA